MQESPADRVLSSVWEGEENFCNPRARYRSVSHAKRPICETLPRRWPSLDRIGRSECISPRNFANPSWIVFGLSGGFCISGRELKLFRRNWFIYRVEKSTMLASCENERLWVIKLNNCEIIKQYVLIQLLKLQLLDKYTFCIKKWLLIKQLKQFCLCILIFNYHNNC